MQLIKVRRSDVMFIWLLFLVVATGCGNDNMQSSGLSSGGGSNSVSDSSSQENALDTEGNLHRSEQISMGIAQGQGGLSPERVHWSSKTVLALASQVRSILVRVYYDHSDGRRQRAEFALATPSGWVPQGGEQMGDWGQRAASGRASWVWNSLSDAASAHSHSSEEMERILNSRSRYLGVSARDYWGQTLFTGESWASQVALNPSFGNIRWTEVDLSGHSTNLNELRQWEIMAGNMGTPLPFRHDREHWHWPVQPGIHGRGICQFVIGGAGMTKGWVSSWGDFREQYSERSAVSSEFVSLPISNAIMGALPSEFPVWSRCVTDGEFTYRAYRYYLAPVYRNAILLNTNMTASSSRVLLKNEEPWPLLACISSSQDPHPQILQINVNPLPRISGILPPHCHRIDANSEKTVTVAGFGNILVEWALATSAF